MQTLRRRWAAKEQGVEQKQAEIEQKEKEVKEREEQMNERFSGERDRFQQMLEDQQAELDQLRKVVAHDLGHQHTVRKVACNRALRSGEWDLVHPLVNAL